MATAGEAQARPDRSQDRYAFTVDLGVGTPGGRDASFEVCTASDLRSEVVEYRQKGDPASPRKLPGQSVPPHVTLKRGVAHSRACEEWLSLGPGRHDRREVVIWLEGEGRDETMRTWTLASAWVAALGPSSSGAGNGGVTIDELVLACEGISSGCARFPRTPPGTSRSR